MASTGGFMDGYKPIKDSGERVPSPCGTEEANEAFSKQKGSGTAGDDWSQRKFTPGPVIDYDEGKDSLPDKKHP